MMSLSGVFASIGASLGVAVGGLALSQSGFQLLGATFGVFGVVSALVIYTLAKDPCKT
jgi:predicted MFS family arabinose efflux permease